MSLNIEEIRAMFPVLHQEVNGKPLIYFDNAATTQKPKAVLEALSNYYEKDNSNIHRGAHALADRATRYYEETREAIREFIGAREAAEVIFTKVKGVQKDNQTIDLESFITVKGIKALGNQLTADKIKQINRLEPLPYEEPIIEEESPEFSSESLEDLPEGLLDDDGQITLNLE